MFQIRFFRGLKFGLALGVVVYLAGCAQTPLVPPVSVPLSEPSALGQWSGRFALKVDRVTVAETQSTHQDSVQGGFNLASKLHGTTLELNSPLGQTIAIIRSAPGFATLLLGDGKKFQAASIQELLEAQLGWRLPIDRLPGALSVLNSESIPVADKAKAIAQTLGQDWTAELAGLDAGRSRLVLAWQGLSRNVTKLVLTLIIEPQVGVSTNLRR